MGKHRVAAGSVLAGLVLAGAVGARAQVSGATTTAAEAQRTGVAHPDDAPIEATADQPVVVKAKPSAAVPAVAVPASASGSTSSYGAYVPYTGTVGATPVATGKALTEDQADGAVVTSVDDPLGALREGTLLHARVRERLTTLSTEEGTRFSAELVTPVEKDGRVVLPVGSVVSGRVTSVHGGRRISGKAMIHLEADTIQVPNGPRYTARMQVIDTDQMGQTKVDREGSLVKRDHPKETAAVLGLSAGGAAAAGGVAAGPVGAVVGAGVGAGVGTVLWLKQDRQEVIPEHAMLVFMLSRDMPLVQHGEMREVASSHAVKPVRDPDATVVGADQ